ncbi:hypothetical protein IID19_03410 [Patescibacteria group bacterium]|nr:hypothetical protein [Patescibacteria group bacterium]
MKLLPKNQRGYIALIAVIIILSVTLAISLTMNVLSVDETKTGLLKQQSAQSFAVADACMREAYLRVKRDNSYTGGNLNIGVGSCTIVVSSLGDTRTIIVDSDVNGIQRQLESQVTIVGNTLDLDYWQELN